MKVNIAKVRRAEGEISYYDLTEDFSSVQSGVAGLSFQSPVHVRLRVVNTGKSLLASGQIETTLKAVCGRCLEEYEYKLQAPYEDEWVDAARATDEERENALIYERDEVEIGERVLEQIVLALPMKFVCSPECQGLCPTCGVNRNLSTCHCSEVEIDPRLAELAKWRSK